MIKNLFQNSNILYEGGKESVKLMKCRKYLVDLHFFSYCIKNCIWKEGTGAKSTSM